MFVEISQIQRFNIFLGHPVYSLSVSLFALLISTGIGSYLTSRSTRRLSAPLSTTRNPFPGSDVLRLSALLTLLLIFGGLTPHLIEMFRSASTPVRIIIAALSLFPIGLFMGTAFPIGIRIASHSSRHLIPWLWGINGAMSILASVLAVLIAMTFGIKAAYWTGFACYTLAVGIGIFLCTRQSSNFHDTKELAPLYSR